MREGCSKDTRGGELNDGESQVIGEGSKLGEIGLLGKRLGNKFTFSTPASVCPYNPFVAGIDHRLMHLDWSVEMIDGVDVRGKSSIVFLHVLKDSG